MKKLIDKLVKILKEYEQYCIRTKMREGVLHTLKGSNHMTPGSVSLYFEKYGESNHHVVLYIDSDLEISSLFSTKFSMDTDMTIATLKKRIQSTEDTLTELKSKEK